MGDPARKSVTGRARLLSILAFAAMAVLIADSAPAHRSDGTEDPTNFTAAGIRSTTAAALANPATASSPVPPPIKVAAPATGSPVGLRPAPRPAAPVMPASVQGGGVLYLSFDDGPSPVWTPQILAVLARHHARATFFLIGRNLVSYPALFDEELRSGQTVGNHTYTHPHLTRLSQSQFNTEITRTAALLGPRASNCVRPPYGDHNARTDAWTAQLGLRVQMWSIDPRDWLRPGTDTIVQRVLTHVANGGVLIMHDGGGDRSQSVAALEKILTTLDRHGWTYQPVC